MPGLVRKRNNAVTEFDAERIRSAVRRAFEAADPSDRDDFSSDVDRVFETTTAALRDFAAGKDEDYAVPVEEIQEMVETALMQCGFFEAAKRYIRYRFSHQKLRQSRSRSAVEKAGAGELSVLDTKGRRVLFSLENLEAYMEEQKKLLASEDRELIDCARVVRQVLPGLSESISTDELRTLSIQAAAGFIEEDPVYDEFAALLHQQALMKTIMDREEGEAGYREAYRGAFITGIRRGVEGAYLDKRLGAYDLERLSERLIPSRDREIRFIGSETLKERYILQIDGKPVESFQAFWMRVSMGLAIAEDQMNERALEFYDLISNLRFIPSTPTLFHSGLVHPQLSSCYLSTVKDDLTHIFKSMGDNASLSKWSGGIGNDWTNIRGTGAFIKTTKVNSQGVIPFLKIANDVTVAINRSGKRRGATCAYLETWHYDIEDFLDLRRNTGDDRRRTHDMNTANWVPDLFMERVESEGMWTLFSPDETPDLHHLYGAAFRKRYEHYEREALEGRITLFRRVEAVKLWRKMLTRLFETGHPWITFKDPSNIRSPQDHAGVVHNSNLCTEITLNNSEDETAVCNLGSINLARHIIDGETGAARLSEALLEDSITTAVRMLDNVIDLNFYPTEEARNSNLRHRPVGMGIMGFQDSLFLQRLGFNDAAAESFADQAMELVSFHTILASSKLAKERGAYESYPGSKWDRGILPQDTLEILEAERGRLLDVQKGGRLDWGPVREHIERHGMRNSNTMAVAPTATISNIAGVYPCIEPAYKNLYVKSNMCGEFTLVNRYLAGELKKHGLWTPKMRELLKYHDGSIAAIEAVPEEIRSRYLEAFEIDPVVLMRFTARRGKWIDQSQSHNIFMKGTSGRQLDRIYKSAWRMGLKTTYYLRSLAASQVEKSTLDAKVYGFTQKRSSSGVAEAPGTPLIGDEVPRPRPGDEPFSPSPLPAAAAASASVPSASPPPAPRPVSACSLMEPECEACQ